MYEFIFLDLDNTLFDFNKSEAKAFEALTEYVNVPFSIEMFAHYITYNQHLWKQIENGKLTKKELLNTRFPNFFSYYQMNNIPNDADEYYRHQLSITADVIDGAHDLLINLRSHNKKLFAASNGVYQTQISRLQRTGLMPYFDQIFISEQLGYSKPHPLFFKEAFKQISNFKLDCSIMIGDSLTSDMKGAHNVKMDAIWFNPVATQSLIPTDLSIKYIAHTLKEVEKIVLR